MHNPHHPEPTPGRDLFSSPSHDKWGCINQWWTYAVKLHPPSLDARGPNRGLSQDKQHLGSWPLHSYDPQTSHLTWSHRTETKEGAKTQDMTLRDVTV